MPICDNEQDLANAIMEDVDVDKKQEITFAQFQSW